MTEAEMTKLFRDFEAKASARLQAARDGGFDVAAIEEVNAQGRAKLLEEVAAKRTSSLRQLVADLDAGDL